MIATLENRENMALPGRANLFELDFTLFCWVVAKYPREIASLQNTP
jgi:hypothetical protein